MATFSDDFSTRSGTATVVAPTGIAGYTLFAGAGSEGNISASIQTDGTAIGGKVLRWDDTGWGEGVLISPDDIGGLSAGVAAEVLVGFKFGTLAGTKGGHFSTVGPIIRALTDMSKFNGVGFQRNGGTPVEQFQGWYFNVGNDWSNMGSAKVVTGTIVAGDWWWSRMSVTAGGSWSWKVWKDGVSEPGYDVTGASETSQTSGHVGVGGYDNTPYGPIDIQWLSVGTAGSAAPSPGGSPPPATVKSLSLLGVG
jgi:hypothetical protein